ncbi:MAG: penicillin-binding protein 2 [Elusimicrobia bacterium]|nr:penicillin-binding protein 2 [Elusimicrobiota bacterium]
MRIKYRLIFTLGVLMLMYGGLGFRLFDIQINRHKKLKCIAESSYTIHVKKVSPTRGEIMDRNAVPLAINRHTYSIGFNPRQNKISDELLAGISAAAGIGRDRIKKQVDEAEGFIWLARQVDAARTSGLEKYQKDGLILVRENHRFYPNAPLASRVIGCVGTDNQGLSGIEYNFDEQLKGEEVEDRLIKDAKGRILHLYNSDNKDVTCECRISLTIDLNLQYIVERELIAGYKKYKPKSAMAVIQDPHTGEVLAMGVYPSYDNNSGVPQDIESLKNSIVSGIFEPGSTFKIVTAAAALQEGLVEIDEIIDCEGGEFEVGGFPIRDFSPHDSLTFRDCMVHSSNIGLAKVGDRVGSKMLYKYARDFGFGNFTGIRLPGETRGILRKPDRWSGTSLSRISFGQEIGVTAIQLVGAFSLVANGGILYEPRIIKYIEVNGRERDFEPMPIRRVISEETAAELRDILVEVVRRGSGDKGAVKGYKVAGKTGTAQKFNVETSNYEENKFVALFGGFVPADDPKLTIVVVFDEPDESLYWGGYVAAPVFSAIAKASLNYLNIIPENEAGIQ